MTFAASATLIELALWVPASTIDWYSSSTKLATSGVDPEVTLTISFNLWDLSPGLILSGLYPTKKSELNLRLDSSSKIGQKKGKA